eukprot:gene42160-52273_t
MRHIADKYALRPHIVFGEEAADAKFDGRRWRVTMKSGRQDSGEFLVSACGFLHHPREPEIPGLESFAGKRFHSARWDMSVDLKGKRIGLIGAKPDTLCRARANFAAHTPWHEFIAIRDGFFEDAD